MDRVDVVRSNTLLTKTNVYSRTVGSKNYELTDHLGNVRAVVGDIKLPSGMNFTADLKSSSDYYPFGMALPKPTGTPSGVEVYRYGYNGKEKDDEVKGEGNSYDYGARIYDSRLGRFLTLDPLESKHPHLSGYNYCRNNPLLFIDEDGRDFTIASAKITDGRLIVKMNFTAVILNHTGNAIDAEKLKQSMVNQVERDFKADFKLNNKAQQADLSKALNMTIPDDIIVSVEMNAEVRIGSSPTDVKNGEHKINVMTSEQFADAAGSKNSGVGANAMTELLGNDMYLKDYNISDYSLGSVLSHEVGHFLGLPHYKSWLSESLGFKDKYPNAHNGYANQYNLMWSGKQQDDQNIRGLCTDVNTPQFVRAISNVAKGKDNQEREQVNLEQKFNNDE